MTRDVDGDDPLAVALAYAALGWRVIPIPPGEKHPVIQAWQEKGTTDSEQIIDWWHTWPDHGVGVLTGPDSGIFVIDVDEHGAESGSDTLADLEATYGALPPTPVVLTGGGGAHYYFRYPPGVTISNDAGRRLGPGIDIRADGGQVIAPPSLHANGRHYTWDVARVPTDSAWLIGDDEVAVADPPAWLIDLVTAEPPERRERPPPKPDGELRLPGEKWAAVTDWGELLRGDGAVFLGERTEHSTGTTYELWARPGLEGHHASASLGYRGSDVLKVFSTNWPGLMAGETYTKFGYWAYTRHGGDMPAARADLEAQGYGSTPANLADLIAQGQTEGEDRDPVEEMARLGILPLVAFFEGDAPEYDWLVPGLIERRDRVIITGDEGGGKSTLLRQLGLGAAVGRNSFAMSPENVVHEPVRVFLIDAENSERQLRREFPRSLGPVTGIAQVTGRFFVAMKTAGLALDNPKVEDRAWLAQAVELLRPDIIFMGPLYKLIDQDPNAEIEAKATALFLDKLRVHYDVALVIEAHAPHGMKRPFGWSGWKRWPEFGLHLSDENLLIPFRGGRDDTRQWPTALRRGRPETDEWPWVPIHDAPELSRGDSEHERELTVRMLIVRELKATGRRLTIAELVERTGKDKRIVIQAIRHMEDIGRWLITDTLTAHVKGREVVTEVFHLDPEGHAFD